ncbi:MAG: hypothetical protein LBU70_08215 [Chitinispirillales bacterium]|jgi:hypothetical protein|nr:hypothetical protein [Chitinispirillales bacterium]
MDTTAIIAKIVGLVLLCFTARSVYKHFKGKAIKRNAAAAENQSQNQGKDKGKQQEQSKIEHTLNTLLLYAWFIFMTAFSLGMILNN